MSPIRLLSPQEQTFKMAMSVLSPNSSALPPGADVLEACARLPVLTHNGHSRRHDLAGIAHASTQGERNLLPYRDHSSAMYLMDDATIGLWRES